MGNKNIMGDESGYSEIGDYRIADVLMHMVDAVILLDPASHIVFVNTAAERIFGYTSDELTGLHAEILAPERFRGVEGGLQAIIASARTRQENEFQGLSALRKDGSEFPLEMGVTLLEGGKAPLLVVTARDVTERELAEQRSINRSRRSLRYKESLVQISTQAFENLQGALRSITRVGAQVLDTGRVGVWKLDGNTLCCINRYSASIGAHEHGLVLPMADSSRYLAALRDGITIRVNDARADPLTRDFNESLLHPFHIYSMLDVPIWSNGRALGILCIEHTHSLREWTDEEEEYARALASLVSISMEAEQRRLANIDLVIARNAANAATQAKSLFLSSMSHEMRTPLNSVLGFLELLEIDTAHLFTEEQKHWLQTIRQSGEHLLALVSELLDLARIEAGKISLSLESVAARAVIDETLAVARALTLKYGVSLLDRSALSLPLLFADRLRTKQILLNLLSNAMKYNRKGGTVWMDAEALEGMLRIRVTDSGFGISHEDQSKLFQAFQRLGAETSAVEGTGIGLVICKALVEKMDGRIGFESTPGTGSSFWVDLPVAAAHSPPENMPDALIHPVTAVPSSSVAAAFSGTVLFVEDNPGNMELMRAVIDRIPGLSLIEAISAEAGIAVAARRLPDLIILDINLPGMSGFEVLRELKRDELTRHIPVLAYSADASIGTIQRGLAAGFRDYLSKPLKIDELVKAIRLALER